jgi:hypothetical protein
MLEVAIASVEGVLDWRAYQEELREDASKNVGKNAGREVEATLKS